MCQRLPAIQARPAVLDRRGPFDLRRAAVVHNLHVIARQPAARNYQLAA